ncbi:ATP-binding protein [Phenylobacterium sp. LjRoot225]|uniref:hybrid sensor histidine kinase/response regulator n=1 Tax=Phenylobacterium sp. LjRoot225 TaxID=3342285 RepID=UPI003ECF821C
MTAPWFVTAGVRRARRFWRHHAVILVALVAFAMIMLGFASLIVYAGVATNRITQARETELLQRAADRRLVTLLEDLTSATVWNDAYEKSIRPTDWEWLDVNFGQYYSQYLKHDLTIAFDAQDRPFYASLGGQRVPVKRLESFASAVRPILLQVRAREHATIIANPQSLGFPRVAAAGAGVRVGRDVYLAQASTVVPEPGYKGRLVARHPIVVTAIRIGPKYLEALNTDYGLRRARLVAAVPPSGPSVAVRGSDGAPIGALVWTPEQPGVGVYANAKWTILAVAALITLLLAVLVRRMDRMTFELRVARENADAANRAKSEFLANISHEIRTPLNGVLGMAHVMSAADLSAPQRERLTVIQESGATLLALLNDVLDLSKIQAGKLELEQTAFNLHDLCRTVCATFEGLAAAKDLQLGFTIEAGDPLWWKGDALRIRQVLSNLISNAVKFTEQGTVRLHAAAAEGGLAFSVIDTGIGLRQDQVARLFQKFSQADASTTRRYGGSGLGLAICYDLVHLMGGELRVQSALGEGSAFTFILPLQDAPELSGPAPSYPDGQWTPENERPLRVLAAEDNPTNQLVLRALLQPLDLDLRVVSNGLEALQAFREASFDLVLMDVQMPEMGGVEATRAIRRHEAESGRGRTPVVALSANVMTHQIEDYWAAGMDGHLGKPIEVAKLYKLLEEVAAGSLLPARAAS